MEVMESKGKSMCPNLLLVFGCFLLTVRAQTGKMLPPRNVSLSSWEDEFTPCFSWAAPENVEKGCGYHVHLSSHMSHPSHRHSEYNLYHETSPFCRFVVGTILNFSIKTDCNGNQSEPAVLRITYPELVKDVQCSSHTKALTYCSWKPVIHLPDLQFIYWLPSGGKSDCSDYVSKDGVKIGCRLHTNKTERKNIFMLFNGILNNTSVKNTFEEFIKVKPLALNWTVIKAETQFNISWTPPDIWPHSWHYTLKYTECGKEKNETNVRGTSMTLEYKKYCAYNISIIATGDPSGQTPWSQETYFAAETEGPAKDPLIYAAIIIPVMFTILAALAFVCVQKYKDKIFPKVPEPRDLLRDIFDSNNDTKTVGSLYVPAEEEDSCKITLVVDQPYIPQRQTSDPAMH